GPTRMLLAQQLDGRAGAQLHVRGFVDEAHAPASNPPDETIATELLAAQVGIGRHGFVVTRNRAATQILVGTPKPPSARELAFRRSSPAENPKYAHKERGR